MQDLLFLSQRIPFPPNKGDKIRSYHVLQDLCRHYRVHLGCFIDDPNDWQYLPMIRQLVTSCQVRPLSRRRAALRSGRALLSGAPLSLPYFYDRQMADWVTSLVTKIDPAAAYVFSSPMLQYLMHGARPRRVVMDFVDVDSQKWLQYSAGRPWPLSALYRREAERLLSFEREAARFADSAIFVSEPEKRLFCSLAPESADHVYAIGNGTDSAYFSPDGDFPPPIDPHFPTIVFTGAMDYWPNIDAVSWFVAEIFPILRRAEPRLRLVIVGLNPTAAVLELGKVAGVMVTGRVPDVRPYLAHADVVVAPLRTARGVQNKVLEAMSMARPVVATSQAFEGIEAVPQRHLLVADGAVEFAAATLRALHEPGSRAMGLAAREQIRRAYGWGSQLARFRALLADPPSSRSIAGHPGG